MSDYLRQRERELKLEKIRGKATSTPSKPKEPPKLKRMKLGMAWLYPLDEEPTEGGDPRSLPRSTPLKWLDGFALVNDGLGGLNILGWLSYDDRAGKNDWWWAAPGQRLVSEKYATLREAAEDQSGLARANATDKQWDALARLEARVRKDLDR